MNIETLQNQDVQTLWHPCSQMKDYELFRPLVVTSASGSYIELADGRTIIDAISSWWCKSLGHNHPALKKAILTQIEHFEHVVLANTTNELIVQLSQDLVNLMPHLAKVFYASDGSCAVEIALKMSMHTRMLQGHTDRKQFLSLKNSFHGETIGALSVSDLGIYREPYSALLFETLLIEVPYVTGIQDPKWHDAFEEWLSTEKFLRPFSDTTTALIIEPILQAAGGMQIISQDFLHRLCQWAKTHDIHIIADEILTGLGRTGKMLACEYADIQPDFLCLSKGLTSGWLPMSAVVTTDAIYEVFYDDYENGKSFLHSHTHSGNALAASVALATLRIIQEENLSDRAQRLQKIMMSHLEDIADKTQQLKNLRGIGAVVAADLIVDNPHQRLGYKIYQEAVKRGALLRPLGNTLYWLPPLNIEEHTISELKNITYEAIIAGIRS